MSRHWPSCEHQRACGLNRPAYTFLPRTWIKRIWGICHDLFLSSQAKSSLYSLCGPLSPLWPLWVLVFRPARAFVLGNPACLCTKFRFWCFADNAWNRRNALKGFLRVATWALKTIEYFRTIKGGAWRCTRCTTQDKSHVHRGTSLNTATGAMCTHWEQFTCTLAADPGAKITGAGSNWQCFHWHGPYVPSILQSSLLFVDVTVWMIVNGLHHVYIYIFVI